MYTLLCLNTSWIWALCFRTCLDFMILTILAWMKNSRSFSTSWRAFLFSCGVSFSMAPAAGIRNLVLLLMYLRLTEMAESGERLSVLTMRSLASNRDWTNLKK